MKKFNQPEIFYEETHDGLSSGFPFMNIEKNENIPNVLFIGMMSDTEEKIDENSEETLKEVAIQSYYNSESIKKIVTEEVYLEIKKSLGLIRKEK